MTKNNNFYFKKSRSGLMLVGGLMSLLVAFSLTPTFAGLVAQIQNSVNTAVTGSLVMKESSGGQTCLSNEGVGNTTNTATCSRINKYGGETTPLVPGQAREIAIKIENVGTIDATAFTVTGGTCSQSSVGGTAGSARNLCEKINIVIKSGGTNIFQGTAKDFQNAGAINILQKLSKSSIAKSEGVDLTISIALDGSADSTYQALKISQPITWQFGA